MRVLVVEDDGSLRALLAELISEVADDVHAVDGLPEVIPAGERYDLALVDLVPLRRYDAWAARQFVDAVRQLAGRVVVVTAHPGALVDGAAALGADLVLPKPFQLEEVLAAIEQY